MGGIIRTAKKAVGSILGVPKMEAPAAATVDTPAPAAAAVAPTEAAPENAAEKVARTIARGKKSVTVKRSSGAGVGLNV